MNGNEFIKKIRRYGKKNALAVTLVQKRGKGSHSLLYLGTKRTTIRNLFDELKSGTLTGMLKQLGLTRDDI
ncbi:MAG: type II toxin-antitoxin system HicA family toxin [Magnetococcus sp. DMHC-1]